MRILAIVTDADGGYGGIAQYNRDLISALPASPLAEAIDVLPRGAPEAVGALPDKVRQHRPVRVRSAMALAEGGAAGAMTDGELSVLTDEASLPEALAGAPRATPRPPPAEVRRRFRRDAFRARVEVIFASMALAKDFASRDKTTP